MIRLQKFAEATSSRSLDSTRHKCFVSYHVDDIVEVEQFIDSFASEFIPRSVGVTIEDDFVDSTEEDYIKRRIRDEYLSRFDSHDPLARKVHLVKKIRRLGNFLVSS